MGRLDDIVARNKHPGRHRQRKFPLGIIVSAFVLLVLVLMIFTDLGTTPMPAPEPSPAPSGERRVRGIELRTVPSVQRDAASDVAPQPR